MASTDMCCTGCTRLEAARDDGQEFAAAWVVAVDQTIREISDQRERTGWRRAPAATRAGWQRAYDRASVARVDRQLALVGSERGVAATGRACVRCGGEVARRDPRAVCCSDRCRREGMPAAA